MSSVPPIQFLPTGLVLPAESAILSAVQSDTDAAFGGGLNPALNTPQGQLASSLTAVIGDKNNDVATVINQVDPAFSSGRFQDAIGRIYFIERIAATSTSVQALCTGATGTVIPTGAQAQASDANRYICTQGGTIGSGGTVTLTFAAVNTGPIACPTGALNQIYQLVPGWESITNVAAGIPGTNVETPQAFELRRKNSVAANSSNNNLSVKGAVLSIEPIGLVTDCFVVDNPTSGAVTIQGVSIAANSLYVSVSGTATNAQIAGAIFTKKPPGIPTVGTTAVSVPDTSYSAPQPTYSISFTTATNLPVYVAISYAANAGLPTNINDQIATAIINAAAGLDGGTIARIGGTIYSARFYAGIMGLSPYMEILSLAIGPAASPTATSMTTQINQKPVFSESTMSFTPV